MSLGLSYNLNCVPSCNSFPKLWKSRRPQTTEIHCITTLEAGGPESRNPWGHAPLSGGGAPSCHLHASRGLRAGLCSLTCDSTALSCSQVCLNSGHCSALHPSQKVSPSVWTEWTGQTSLSRASSGGILQAVTSLLIILKSQRQPNYLKYWIQLTYLVFPSQPWQWSWVRDSKRQTVRPRSTVEMCHLGTHSSLMWRSCWTNTCWIYSNINNSLGSLRPLD